MKNITITMINLYGLSDIDFMGYTLTSPTFHHIQKKCNGGKEMISNGAILTECSHQYLHNAIETREIEMYDFINRLLLYQNQNGINEEVIKVIHSVLEDFESKYENEYTRKGKLLIKRKYLER